MPSVEPQTAMFQQLMLTATFPAQINIKAIYKARGSRSVVDRVKIVLYVPDKSKWTDIV